LSLAAQQGSRESGKSGGNGAKARGNGFMGFLRKLGPGVITGAADDDPSGIATYSQTGAQFGLGQLWTALY
jgi:Mn2+/Fe2+ NRAMP family transporter